MTAQTSTLWQGPSWRRPRRSRQYVVELVVFMEGLADFYAEALSEMPHIAVASSALTGYTLDVACVWGRHSGGDARVPALVYAYSEKTLRLRCNLPGDSAAEEGHEAAQSQVCVRFQVD